MSNYYTILHDGDPGPRHLDNILSKRHEDFMVSAHLYPDKVVVRSSFKLGFELARAPRGPIQITIWDGPTFLHLVPMGSYPNNLIAGDILNTDLTWTQMVENMVPESEPRKAPLLPAWLTRKRN